MSIRIRTVLTAALLLVGSRAAAAQFFVVSSGNLGSMNIVTAVAGSPPTPVTASTTTYWLLTIQGTGATRLQAYVDVALPPGVTLTVTLPSPGGGIVSAGAVALTTAPQDVLTNLPNSTTFLPGGPITYVLSATPDAGVVASTPRRITFMFQ